MQLLLKCLNRIWSLYKNWRSPGCELTKVMDCCLKIKEFNFQSRNCILFLTNTLEKGMNLLILPAMD